VAGEGVEGVEHKKGLHWEEAGGDVEACTGWSGAVALGRRACTGGAVPRRWGGGSGTTRCTKSVFSSAFMKI
jgi:hypothetical protein